MICYMNSLSKNTCQIVEKTTLSTYAILGQTVSGVADKKQRKLEPQKVTAVWGIFPCQPINIVPQVPGSPEYQNHSTSVFAPDFSIRV